MSAAEDISNRPQEKLSFWDQVRATAETVGDRVKEGAAAAKLETDKHLTKARESEAWQQTKASSASAWEQTKEGSQKAWLATQEAARTTRGHAEEAFIGKVRPVGFTEAKLGMTLAREGGGKARPVVSRVDEGGAAYLAGVREGDIVVSMRAGLPSEEVDATKERPTEEPTIKVESYDHLMGLFPAMGRPVTISFLTPTKRQYSTGGVVNFKMEDEIEKATRIVARMTAERAENPDKAVPREILRRARGLAFIRVAKVGFGLSVKVGTGIVVTRLGDNLDSWSAPCAIGTAGMGWGFQIGAELTDFMIVLNTPEAVEAFASGHQVSLGGDVGIAIGPVGRSAAVSGNIHGGELSSRSHRGEGAAAGGGGATSGYEKSKVGIAPCYAYSHSKGLFVGISLEGAVITPRKDVNAGFYAGGDQTQAPSAREILSGMTQPPASCEGLYEELAAGIANEDDVAELAKYGYTNSSGVSSPIRTEPMATPAAAGGGATTTANPFQDSSDSSSSSNSLPSGGVDVGEVEEAEAVDEATKVEI